MQKTVLEVLKRWHFSYSAFWSAGQWVVEGYCPPGHATGLVDVKLGSVNRVVTTAKILIFSLNLYATIPFLNKVYHFDCDIKRIVSFPLIAQNFLLLGATPITSPSVKYLLRCAECKPILMKI